MTEERSNELEDIADAAVRPAKRPRGFAAMSREAVREIARKGGVAAHLPGRHGHEFTSEEAKEAGRKGGRASYAKRRASSTP